MVLQTSAVQRHRSTYFDLCLEKAAVWAKKAEVGEGADKGADESFVVLFNDLECFC